MPIRRISPEITRGAAHIHLTLTPPGGAEGWLDDLMFSDDPLLSARDRAGRAVVMPRRDAEGVWHAVRNLLISDIRR
jgi:protocatechuate 3,4-dioxygenase beta subunit